MQFVLPNCERWNNQKNGMDFLQKLNNLNTQDTSIKALSIDLNINE